MDLTLPATLQNCTICTEEISYMARRLSASQARASFAEAVNRASFAGERTVIRRHGKDVAAVVSAEDLKILEALEDRRDLEEARDIMKKPGRLISWEKIKKDLKL
jgi:prevent-host-death family protein